MTPRRRGAWVPGLVLLVVLAEIVVFVLVGQLLGALAAVLLVVAASLMGAALVSREGLRAWRGFRSAAQSGEPPGPRVTDGLVGLAGALLLATPGLVTGVAGATVLVPPVRRLVRGRLQVHIERRLTADTAGVVFGPRRVRADRQPDAPPGDTEVVEGEVLDQ